MATTGVGAVIFFSSSRPCIRPFTLKSCAHVDDCPSVQHTAHDHCRIDTIIARDHMGKDRHSMSLISLSGIQKVEI